MESVGKFCFAHRLNGQSQSGSGLMSSPVQGVPRLLAVTLGEMKNEL